MCLAKLPAGRRTCSPMYHNETLELWIRIQFERKLVKVGHYVIGA
jgi:hypothetical protein